MTRETGHGRTEGRMYFVSDIFDEFVNFSFDYISSAKLTAEQLDKASREHWHIENRLHWKLSVAMREDESRIRRNDGAEILAGFRHIAVNLLNNTKPSKQV